MTLYKKCVLYSMYSTSFKMESTN